MNQDQLRVMAATGLISGGCLFVVWSVGGRLIASEYSSLVFLLLLASYVGTIIGIGGLSQLARRTDDAIASAITPLAIGTILLIPLVMARTVTLESVPFKPLILLVTVGGMLSFVFGLGLLIATLLFTSTSTLVTQPWGRSVALLGISGALGWVVSFATAAPDPPQAYRVVTPYTSSVAASTIWIVICAFTAGGLALCLLGIALLHDRHTTPGMKKRAT